MEKLLIMNPGSTSTKIAVYDDETPVFVESIAHSTEELAKFDEIKDQYEFRRDMILDALEKHGVKLEDLTAIVSRCGLLPPIEAGAYKVNEDKPIPRGPFWSFYRSEASPGTRMRSSRPSRLPATKSTGGLVPWTRLLR